MVEVKRVELGPWQDAPARVQIAIDAQTLAAYAVALASGAAFEPFEFEHLAVIASRHGMIIAPGAIASWIGRQAQGVQDRMDLARVGAGIAPARPRGLWARLNAMLSR